MRGFMLAAVVVAVVVMVRTAFGNEYDPCDDPHRAVLEVIDKGEETKYDSASERSAQLLMRYLIDHCKMESQEVSELFVRMAGFKKQEMLSGFARERIQNPKPYVGLYKRSLVVPQEWDMIAMFVQTGLNRKICEDARKVVMQSTNTEGYRCVQLPEDWRKHSVDQVVGRALTPGPRDD